METLVINVDNEKDANALIAQLNQLNYIRNVVWTKRDKDADHILPGEPLSDDVLNKLLDEAELDTESFSLDEVEQKINSKFKNIWTSDSDESILRPRKHNSLDNIRRLSFNCFKISEPHIRFL